MSRSAIGIFGFLSLMCLAGCRGGPTVFIHPNADFSSIKKVAVIPFESLTPDRIPADKAHKLLIAELLSLGAFEVIEPGLVLKAMTDAGVASPSGMTPLQIKKVGSVLGVQALMLGAVIDFGETRGGTISSPDVTIQLRLVETQSGMTLWSASHTRSGAKLRTRLFGVGGETPTQAAQKLMRQELDTFLEK